MRETVTGGLSSYGHVAGILMSDSTIPRIPGDPGHAETFSFPVLYEVLEDFPFQDLVDICRDHVDIIINCARRLEKRGVRFVAADCGLFGPFQQDLKQHLKVPFIGTALDLVPLLERLSPHAEKVGILTGDTRILKSGHLKASGVDTVTVEIAGMEDSADFKRVVIERHQTLDVDNMRQGVLAAAERLSHRCVGAVVLECTNLIPFRLDIQQKLRKPVFDLVSLIEFYVSGLTKRSFGSRFVR